jgi:hypothetical protein
MCRCDERLKAKTEGVTSLVYTRGVSIWFLPVKFDVNEPLMQEHFEYVEFLYKK